MNQLYANVLNEVGTSEKVWDMIQRHLHANKFEASGLDFFVDTLKQHLG